jgi:hypothetical protein
MTKTAANSDTEDRRALGTTNPLANLQIGNCNVPAETSFGVRLFMACTRDDDIHVILRTICHIFFPELVTNTKIFTVPAKRTTYIRSSPTPISR